MGVKNCDSVSVDLHWQHYWAGGKNVDTVITASTWLSNILPTPKEELDRELSPSPQQRAVMQV